MSGYRGVGLNLAALWLLGMSAAGQTGTTPAYDAWKRAQLGVPAGRLADAAGIYNDRIAVQVGASGRYNFGAFPVGGAAASGTGSFNLSYSWPNSPASSYATLRVDGTDTKLGESASMPTSLVNNATVSQTEYRLGDIAVSQRLSLVRGPSSGLMDTVAIAYTVTNLGTASHAVGVRVMIDTMLGGNDAAPFRVPGVGALTTERDFAPGQIPSFWQAFNNLSVPDMNAQGTLTGSGATPPDRFVIAAFGKLSGYPWDVTIDPAANTGDSAVGVYWNAATLAPNQSRTVTTLYGLGQQSVAPSGSLRLGVTAPALIDRDTDPVFDIVALIENPTTTAVPSVTATLTVPTGFTLVPATGRASQDSVLLGDIPAGAARQVTWRVDASGAPLGTAQLGVAVTSTDTSIVPSQVDRQVEVQGASSVAIDPLRSTIVATHPVGLADGVDTLWLAIVLRDATGAPVAGVPGSRIVVDAGGAAGVTIVQPTLTTDSSGATLAAAQSTVAGPVDFGCRVGSVALSAPAHALFIAQPVTEVYSLSPGANLLTQPLAEVTTPNTQIAAQVQGMRFVTWDAATSAYVPFDLLSAPFTIGRGFWGLSPDARSLTLEGVPGLLGGTVLRSTSRTSGTSTPAAVDLLGQWNLLGNPLMQAMPWNLSAIKVMVDGEAKGTLDQPATWEWVDPYAFVYQDGQYQLVFDNTWPGFEGVRSSVDMLAGFWARRVPGTATVQLLLDVDALTRSGTAGRATGAGRGASVGWALALSATDGQTSSSVTVGANSRLARPLDVATPPALAGTPLLSVLSAGRSLSGRLVPASGEASFDLLATGAAGRLVTLSWPKLGRELPADRGATLVDLRTGARLALANRAAYSFRADGTPRQLRLVIGSRGVGRPALTLSAGGSRASSAAAITVTVSVPAEVSVEVRGLGGRLVRSLGSQSVPAGSTVLAWDGRDAEGRLVPAGTYQLLATARGDDGSLARAQTLISR